MSSNIADRYSRTDYLNSINDNNSNNINKYKYYITVVDNDNNILNDYNVFIDDQMINDLPTYLDSGDHDIKIDGVCFNKKIKINIQQDRDDTIVTSIDDNKIYIDPNISHIKYIHNSNIADAIRTNPIKPKSVSSSEIEFLCNENKISKLEVLENNIDMINNEHKYRITVHNDTNNKSIIGKEYYSAEEAIRKIIREL